MITILETNQAGVNELIAAGKRVLVEVYFENCGPCKMLKLVLADVAKTAENVEIACISMMENPEFAEQYGISTAPTLLFFENGELKERFMGIQSKSTIVNLLAE